MRVLKLFKFHGQEGAISRDDLCRHPTEWRQAVVVGGHVAVVCVSCGVWSEAVNAAKVDE